VVGNLCGSIDDTPPRPDNVGVRRRLLESEPPSLQPSKQENFARHHDACMKTARIRRTSLKTCDIFHTASRRTDQGSRKGAPGRCLLAAPVAGRSEGVAFQRAPCFFSDAGERHQGKRPWHPIQCRRLTVVRRVLTVRETPGEGIASPRRTRKPKRDFGDARSNSGPSLISSAASRRCRHLAEQP
jgi:hypothetical protein